MNDDTEASRAWTLGLWEESDPDWIALADALRERGFDPKLVAVGDRLSDDPDKEFGVAYRAALDAAKGVLDSMKE